MDWFLYDRDLHHGRVHHISETMLPPPPPMVPLAPSNILFPVFIFKIVIETFQN